MHRIVVVLFLLLAVASTVFASVPTTADENNPRTNPDANACYIGGSLYGKCETYDIDMDKKITVEEIKYMYDAGWFVIRFEKGVILRSQVPRMYRWLLGPEPVAPRDYGPAPVTAPAAPTCYDGAGGLFDVQYTGVSNNPTNLPRFDSRDGSCTNPLGSDPTYYIVVASSLSEADTLCPLVNVKNANTFGFATMPANFYICASFPI